MATYRGSNTYVTHERAVPYHKNSIAWTHLAVSMCAAAALDACMIMPSTWQRPPTILHYAAVAVHMGCARSYTTLSSVSPSGAAPL